MAHNKLDLGDLGSLMGEGYQKEPVMRYQPDPEPTQYGPMDDPSEDIYTARRAGNTQVAMNPLEAIIHAIELFNTVKSIKDDYDARSTRPQETPAPAPAPMPTPQPRPQLDLQDLLMSFQNPQYPDFRQRMMAQARPQGMDPRLQQMLEQAERGKQVGPTQQYGLPGAAPRPQPQPQPQAPATGQPSESVQDMLRKLGL